MSVIRTKDLAGKVTSLFFEDEAMGKKPLLTHSSHLFIPQMLKFYLDLDKACWSVHFSCVTLYNLLFSPPPPPLLISFGKQTHSIPILRIWSKLIIFSFVYFYSKNETWLGSLCTL